MLTPDEIQSLERLMLVRSRPHASAGSRHLRARGHGLEVSDYRHYQPGDDPRLIDWTIEARLRQLVVRVFRAEGRLRLHVLLDTSASMGIGSPAKLTCAARIAAALAYVAVERRDAVGVTTFDSTVGVHVAAAAGRPQLFRTIDVLQSLAAGGRSDIDASLGSFAAVAPGPGLALVVSDFLDPRHTFDGLRMLMHRGWLPALVHVVAGEDLDPALDEEVEIVDAEQPDAPALVVDRRAVAEYRMRMRQMSDRLREFAVTHQLPWLQVRSSAPLDATLAACVNAGLVAVHA